MSLAPFVRTEGECHSYKKAQAPQRYEGRSLVLVGDVHSPLPLRQFRAATPLPSAAAAAATAWPNGNNARAERRAYLTRTSEFLRLTWATPALATTLTRALLDTAVSHAAPTAAASAGGGKERLLAVKVASLTSTSNPTQVPHAPHHDSTCVELLLLLLLLILAYCGGAQAAGSDLAHAAAAVWVALVAVRVSVGRQRGDRAGPLLPLGSRPGSGQAKPTTTSTRRLIRKR